MSRREPDYMPAVLFFLGLGILALWAQSCTTQPVGQPMPSPSSQITEIPVAKSCCEEAWGLQDGTKHTTRGTGYYPYNSKLEGGYNDRFGRPLQTLQGFLAGKNAYVSAAMDKNMGTVKRKLCSPELNDAYGKALPLYVVDTGGAFTGKGWSRIDICTADKKSSEASAINRSFTIIECKD